MNRFITKDQILNELEQASATNIDMGTFRLWCAEVKALLLIGNQLQDIAATLESIAAASLSASKAELVEKQHACPYCGERRVDCLDIVNLDVAAEDLVHEVWEGVHCATCDRIYVAGLRG